MNAVSADYRQPRRRGTPLQALSWMLTGGGLIWAGRGKLVPVPDTVPEAFHPEPVVNVPAEIVDAR